MNNWWIRIKESIENWVDAKQNRVLIPKMQMREVKETVYLILNAGVPKLTKEEEEEGHLFSWSPD